MSDLSQGTPSDNWSEEIPPSDFPLSPDLLKDIPEEQRAQLIQLVSQIEIYGHFSGPLPPPNVLNLYDADTRKTIVAESVEFRRHRNRSESRTLIFFFVRDIFSLIAAFILALVLIVGSIITIQQGQSIEGLLGIGGTVTVIAGAFIVRDRHQRRERESHAETKIDPSPPQGRGNPPT